MQPISEYDAFEDMLFEMTKGILYRDPTIVKDPNFDFEELVATTKKQAQ